MDYNRFVSFSYINLYVNLIFNNRVMMNDRAFKGIISPPSEPPGEIMPFGVSPVNYSDSDSDSNS